MAEISIIIPCYNVENYIDRCMESILQQTFGTDDLEVILVDDASTDGTWDKISAWEKRYPDMVMAVHYDDNGRQGKARNVGLSYATSEWIAFIDSDDWIEPEYLKRLHDAVVKHDADIACCGLIRDPSTNYSCQEEVPASPVRFVSVETEDQRRQFAFEAEMSFPAHSKLIRRSLLRENGLVFPEGLAYEDCCWGSLLYYYAHRICFLEDRLYHYFINTGSTVMQKSADYHTDMLTVHMILWEEYERRGLYPRYRDEIEFNFLYTCYLGFLKILANRYEKPNYSHFMLLRELTREKIPSWRDNAYIRKGLIKDFHLALLETIDRDVDSKSLGEVLSAIRRSGM